MFARHDLIWLSASGWQAACEAAQPEHRAALEQWQRNDWPAVVRRRDANTFDNEICAGVPLPPDPDSGDWQAWQALLSARVPEGVRDREAGLTFQLDSGFGTRSSALIALPAMDRSSIEPVFLFAAGPPDQAPFSPVLL